VVGVLAHVRRHLDDIRHEDAHGIVHGHHADMQQQRPSNDALAGRCAVVQLVVDLRVGDELAVLGPRVRHIRVPEDAGRLVCRRHLRLQLSNVPAVCDLLPRHRPAGTAAR
jgi:hypothetical protein